MFIKFLFCIMCFNSYNIMETTELFYEISFYRSQLEELKTLQKLRERPRGVNIISLAHGQKVSDEEDMLVVSSKFFT